MLTVHDHPHILDETAENTESLCRGGPSLVLCESVKLLQDFLKVLLPESFLYKSDCVALSKATTRAKIDSCDRPRLSFLVARASTESSSTMTSNTISSIAGVGGICVYISIRLRKSSMDSSKLTTRSSSWLA